jgi:hypothetical protein
MVVPFTNISTRNTLILTSKIGQLFSGFGIISSKLKAQAKSNFCLGFF